MKKKTAIWKGVKIEKAKEFKYLDFIIQANGKHRMHIRERIKKSANEILSYAVIAHIRIWGWKQIERLQERYIR